MKRLARKEVVIPRTSRGAWVPMAPAERAWALGVLLAAVLVLPGTGLAQEAAPVQGTPEVEASAEGTGASPDIVPLSLEASEPTAPRLLTEPQEDPRPPLMVRLLAETGMGLVSSTGGAMLGMGSGILMFCLIGDAGYYFLNCILGASATALVGAGLAFPLGLWVGGRMTGGEGSLLLTYAGVAAGAILGTVGILQAQDDRPLMAASLLLPLGGGLLAYELSSHVVLQGKRKVVQLQPAVSLAPNQFSLVLAGRF